MIDKNLKKIRHDYLEDNIISFNDESSFDALLYEISAFSIFSEPKLIVIDVAAWLETHFPQSDALLQAIESNANHHYVFIFNQPKLPNSKIVNFLKTYAHSLVCDALTEKQLPTFIHDLVHEKGGEISNNVAMHLANKLLPDLYLINSEIERLLLISHVLSLQIIQANVVEHTHDDIFALTNAIVNNDNYAIIQSFYERVALGEEPSSLVTRLSHMLDLALQCYAFKSNNHTADEIAEILKIHPYRVRRALKLVQERSPMRLKNLVLLLFEVDLKLKTTSLNPLILINSFILQVIR